MLREASYALVKSVATSPALTLNGGLYQKFQVAIAPKKRLSPDLGQLGKKTGESHFGVQSSGRNIKTLNPQASWSRSWLRG